MAEELKPDELRPCPLCAGTDIKLDYNATEERKEAHDMQVYCSNCMCETDTYDTWDASYKSWNTRPIEDQLKKDNEQLRAFAQKLIDVFNSQPDYKKALKAELDKINEENNE